MFKIFKSLSLIPKGLKYKLMIAFSLMSIIPLLICVWVASNFVFPYVKTIWDISAVIFVGVMVALLGLTLAKEIVDPVVRIAAEAKTIAERNLGHRIEVIGEDEIGQLGTSLNLLTQKIKENMNELKNYGERTKAINIEIHKKVLVLSSLLQIGNLISASQELKTILDFIIEKICETKEGSRSFLLILDQEKKEFRVESASHQVSEDHKNFKIGISQPPASSILSRPQNLILDSNNQPREGIERLAEALGFKNTALFPILLSGRVYGMLIVGNSSEDFVFNIDDIELISVFAKQAQIALENDLLIRRAEELAIRDELTGLFNENYIRARLEEEIKRSILYQRPCSFLLFNVDNFNNFRAINGEIEAEAALKKIGRLLNESVTEVDKVSRFSGDEFAALLPEKNKKQATFIADEVRKKIENLFMNLGPTKLLTVSCGVSENPIDGSDANLLVEKAQRFLKQAKALGKNRVVA